MKGIVKNECSFWVLIFLRIQLDNFIRRKTIPVQGMHLLKWMYSFLELIYAIILFWESKKSFWKWSRQYLFCISGLLLNIFSKKWSISSIFYRKLKCIFANKNCLSNNWLLNCIRWNVTNFAMDNDKDTCLWKRNVNNDNHSKLAYQRGLKK